MAAFCQSITISYPAYIETLSNLWDQSSVLNDVTIICGEEEEKIRAHKIVLANSSRFFRDAFKYIEEVNMPELNKSDLEPILKLMYTGLVTILSKEKSKFLDIIKLLKFEGNLEILHLLDLLPEVLIKILKYLPTRDLLKNVALVSRQFHALTNDFQVPLSFVITPHISEAFVRGLLSRSNQVAELRYKVDHYHTFTPALVLLATSMGLLKKFKALNSDTDDHKMINTILKVFPIKKFVCYHDIRGPLELGICTTLEHVSMSYKKLLLREFHAIASLLHLKTLKVYLSKKIHSRDIGSVISR